MEGAVVSIGFVFVLDERFIFLQKINRQMAKIIAKTISKILFRFNLNPPFFVALHVPTRIWTPILWLTINCAATFTNPISFFIFISIFPDEFGCFVFHFDFCCSFSNSNSAVRVYMGIVPYNVGFVNIDFNFASRFSISILWTARWLVSCQRIHQEFRFWFCGSGLLSISIFQTRWLEVEMNFGLIWVWLDRANGWW